MPTSKSVRVNPVWFLENEKKRALMVSPVFWVLNEGLGIHPAIKGFEAVWGFGGLLRIVAGRQGQYAAMEQAHRGQLRGIQDLCGRTGAKCDHRGFLGSQGEALVFSQKHRPHERDHDVAFVGFSKDIEQVAFWDVDRAKGVFCHESQVGDRVSGLLHLGRETSECHVRRGLLELRSVTGENHHPTA